IPDIGEQEQRQEAAAATSHVDPPLATDVVATVDVPAGVTWILRAGESNRHGSADALARDPSAGSEQRVVDLAERCRCAGGGECGPLGAIEADHGRGPGRSIARIDRARTELVLHGIHAGPNDL